MRIFRRRIVYIQVYRDHLLARLAGGSTIRRQRPALNNTAQPITDFRGVGVCLRRIIGELAPGWFRLRPDVLVHFLPEHYPVSQPELTGFLTAAQRAGGGFCALSKWPTAHTDRELAQIFE